MKYQIPALSEQAKELLAKRYFHVGEKSWSDVCRRVSQALGNDGDEQRAFREVMDHLLFLPNTPCLVNAGKTEAQMSACFYLPVEDSIESIFGSLSDAAKIFQSGGGVGFNFSSLRPNGSPVGGTSGVASGPISFMRVYDAAIQEMKQGGVRRGAAIGLLNCDHPDIVKFISCKSNDKTISNFNISIGITEEFMVDVYKRPNLTHTCTFGTKRFFISKQNGEPVESPVATDTYGLYYTVGEVWDILCHQAWKNGEPGVVFMDAIWKTNGKEVHGVNPCVVGDTLILTRKGYKRIRDIVGLEQEIWNGSKWSYCEPRKTGESDIIYDIAISDGTTISCTGYHIFYTHEDMQICAADLQVGSKLLKPTYQVIEGKWELGTVYAYTAGFFCGDGSISGDKKSLWLYGSKQNLAQYLLVGKLTPCQGNRTYAPLSITDPFDLIYSNTWLQKTFVPSVNYNIQARLDWLAGLIDSDGCRNSEEGSVAISSINREFLYQTKLMLSTLGVWSSVILLYEECTKLMPDGRGSSKEYHCQTSWRLLISAYNVSKLNMLGLHTHRVDTTTDPNRDASRFPTVVSITQHEHLERDVFCVTEPKEHKVCFSGIITGNCAEQPLEDHEACVLGSIDVSKFFDDNGHEITDDEKVRYTLDDTICIAVKMLNRVIDKGWFPLPAITAKVKTNRKIGLGIMGFADLLIKMKLVYGSPESLEFAQQLMKRINTTAHNYSEMCNFQNKTLTTIAPTGSLSIIANCSGGIEPNFGWITRQTRKDFATRVVTHPLVEKYGGGLFDSNAMTVKNLPPYFVTAHEIRPENHVLMQAAFQAHVDNAVSKTVNLSPSATEQNIKDIFKLAWTMKCKGITVYRDESRDDQVISTVKTEPVKSLAEQGKEIFDDMNEIDKIIGEEDEEEHVFSGRPRCLNGYTFKVRVQLDDSIENVYITVNVHEDRPYEIFVQGNIREKNPVVVQSIDSITRLTSLAMQGEVPLERIIEQLRKVPCSHIYSMPHKIATVLDEFLMPTVAEEKEVVQEEPVSLRVVANDKFRWTCPDCTAKMILQEGCMSCRNCGYSKCS